MDISAVMTSLPTENPKESKMFNLLKKFCNACRPEDGLRPFGGGFSLGALSQSCGPAGIAKRFGGVTP
jgi:hypothetical protein